MTLISREHNQRAHSQAEIDAANRLLRELAEATIGCADDPDGRTLATLAEVAS